jgi:hypothetical protein
MAQAQAAGQPQEQPSVDPVDATRVMLEGEATKIDAYRAQTERIEALKPEPQPRAA